MTIIHGSAAHIMFERALGFYFNPIIIAFPGRSGLGYSNDEAFLHYAQRFSTLLRLSAIFIDVSLQYSIHHMDSSHLMLGSGAVNCI